MGTPTSIVQFFTMLVNLEEYLSPDYEECKPVTSQANVSKENILCILGLDLRVK